MRVFIILLLVFFLPCCGQILGISRSDLVIPDAADDADVIDTDTPPDTADTILYDNVLCSDYRVDCTPSCAERVCGFNGCDGACDGPCPDGQYCNIGNCIPYSTNIIYVGDFFAWRGDPDSIVGDIEWAYTYMDAVYTLYVDLFGFELSDLSSREITIDPSSDCTGGLGGWASGGDMGFCAGEWDLNHFCLGLLAHELANTFTGEVTGCWPEDWWANGHSPFPVLASIIAMRTLGYTAEADDREGDFTGDALYFMFKNWYMRYCFDIFQRAFERMNESNIDLCDIPEPDRSYLVMAFLEYGAGEELTSDFESAELDVDRAAIDNYKDMYNLR